METLSSGVLRSNSSAVNSRYSRDSSRILVSHRTVLCESIATISLSFRVSRCVPALICDQIAIAESTGSWKSLSLFNVQFNTLGIPALYIYNQQTARFHTEESRCPNTQKQHINSRQKSLYLYNSYSSAIAIIPSRNMLLRSSSLYRLCLSVK